MQYPADVEFCLQTACTTEIVADQVRAALGRGLKDLCGDGGSGPIAIVANGPSAAAFPFDSRPSMALNGALRLFTDQGLAPTFWAACDPQELVADFLADAPAETIYLIASKCHPRVFDALKDRNVLLWHVDGDDAPDDRTLIPTAVSITLCALTIALWMGFDIPEVWGWDGCYVDGKDHAVSQGHVHDELTIHVGDQTFKTTRTWAAEAHDARLQLTRDGYRPKIHGSSMINAVLDITMGQRAA